MKETTTKLQSMEEIFDEFAKALGHDCCEVHRDAARVVFLSGFTSAMKQVTTFGDLVTDEQKKERLNALYNDCRKFGVEMLARVITGAARAKIDPSASTTPGHN